MEKKQIETILELHRKWLYKEDGGYRADLYGADLRRADLYGADLRRADLYGADLREADLRRADLRRADLRRADLRRADLRRADLRRADLYRADLYGADLRRADLYGADLRRADLYGADLREADLRRADLYGADLYEADLRRAVNLDISIARTCICPEKGSFIGFKKAYYDKASPCIVELEIPADAKRSNATGRKCRASKARIVSITDLDGNPIDGSKYVYSSRDYDFSYSNGATVESTEPFEEDRWNECASGIHFFITRTEAVNY